MAGTEAAPAFDDDDTTSLRSNSPGSGARNPHEDDGAVTTGIRFRIHVEAGLPIVQAPHVSGCVHQTTGLPHDTVPPDCIVLYPCESNRQAWRKDRPTCPGSIRVS